MEELYKKPSMSFYKFVIEDVVTASFVSQNPIADDVTPESDNPFDE